MVRLLRMMGTTALAAALVLPAALPLAAHAQQAGDTSTPATPRTKKKAKHKSTAIPTQSGSGAQNGTATPDPINPSASPEPPTPTTQGPPPAPTTPSTNSPVAPH